MKSSILQASEKITIELEDKVWNKRDDRNLRKLSDVV